MESIPNRPFHPPPTASVTASTSSKPNPLPEDIRIRFSYYASEIKSQVDTLYDEQHKWLEDHLIGVQDTISESKQKKRGTRSVMAGIIKTPSRKRMQASSKQKQIQATSLRFEQPDLSNPTASINLATSHQSDKMPIPTMRSTDSTVHENASRNCDQTENNPVKSLALNKANHDQHHTATTSHLKAKNASSNPAALREIQNLDHNGPLNQGTSLYPWNNSVFHSMGAPPTVFKALGLSSGTPMSQTQNRPDHLSSNGAQFQSLSQTLYGGLNEEDSAALSKTYSSPVKKVQPPVKAPPAVSPPHVDAPKSVATSDVAADPLPPKDNETSECTIIVYESGSFDQNTVDDFHDAETTHLPADETEPEDNDVPVGHELSAIQEGEEDEDHTIESNKVLRQSLSHPVGNGQSSPAFEPSAPIGSTKTAPPQSTSRDELPDRSTKMSSQSVSRKSPETLTEAGQHEAEPLRQSDDTSDISKEGNVTSQPQVTPVLPKGDEPVQVQPSVAPLEGITTSPHQAALVDNDVPSGHQPLDSVPANDEPIELQAIVTPIRADLVPQPQAKKSPATKELSAQLQPNHPSNPHSILDGQEKVDMQLPASLPPKSADHIPMSNTIPVHYVADDANDSPETNNGATSVGQLQPTVQTSRALSSNLSSSLSKAATGRAPTPEADDDLSVVMPDAQPEKLSATAHNMTTEVLLNDEPSRLRNARPVNAQPLNMNTRTPASSSHNQFTPGNGRAALIQSPQSQWSSKPTASAWLNKPHKTPGVAYAGNLGIGIKSEAKKIHGDGGSPVAKDGPNHARVSSTFQSQVNDPIKTQDIFSTRPSSVLDSQGYLSSHRRTSKRTSTEAGFAYTSETQEAKIARPYVPASLRFGPSVPDKTRKGVDDIKNRLSKLQRESAMHERTQHIISAQEPLSTTQRTSLATSGASVHVKPLSITSSQNSNSTSTKASWVPTQSWASTEAFDLSKSQSSRPPALTTSTQQRPATPPPITSLRTYAGVPLVDRGASSEVVVNLSQINTSNNAPASSYANSVSSQSSVPVKRNSVNDLVAVYESKKKPSETNPHTAPVGTTTSPAPSVTLTHETKSKSPVDSALHVAPFDLKPKARTTTPNDSPPVPRIKPKTQDITHQKEPIQVPDFPDKMALHYATTDGEDDLAHRKRQSKDVPLENTEQDLIDLNGSDDDIEVESSESERHDGEEDADDSDGFAQPRSSRQQSPQADEEDVQSDHSDDLSPSASNFHDVYSNSQSTGPLSNAGNITPPPNRAAAVNTPPTGSLMSVLKAGAALATSWTSSKTKPELKSLQLAAVAAKKEQNDKERKAAVKEEREQRRIAVMEKKQADERERVEAERKARSAEVDRKKKEREEALKARSAAKPKPTPLATPAYHRDVSFAGDQAKKRKVDAETSSRTIDPKKAKAHKPEPISVARAAPNSALKTSSSSFQPSRMAPAAPGSVKSMNKYNAAAASVGIKSMAEPIKITNPAPASTSSKVLQPVHQSKLPKPSVGGSSKQKLSAVPAPSSKSTAPPIATTSKGKQKQSEEYIELPDIDSEYSDDDEEEHQRKEAALPDWAQNLVIRETLANQRKLNPNDIFGATIPAPPMDEIFRGRSSRFRHRTSSANWTGTDQLTAMEEAEYAKRMGYHQQQQQRRSQKDK